MKHHHGLELVISQEAIGDNARADFDNGVAIFEVFDI